MAQNFQSHKELTLYDLIIRDATIVSSAGRLVADVAIKGDKIAYVGPRPPRRTKRELSAIGKFLMPGVIDTAAQIAPDDDLDVWKTESLAAVSGGITTMLGVPTGSSPVTDDVTAAAKLDRLDKHSWCNFGLWALANPTNRDAIAKAMDDGTVVAVMALLGKDEDCIAPDDLESFINLPGTLGVQVLTDDPIELRPDADGNPVGSPEAIAVLRAAREHEGSVHWIHLSTSTELDLLDPVRGDLPVTCAVTPQHLLLSVDDCPDVVVRPPLRPEKDRRTLWTALRRGRIDCLASDHHAASPGVKGTPSAELLFPLMLAAVQTGRMSLERLVELCCEAPARVFHLGNKGKIEKGADADLVLFSEGELERVDASTLLSTAGWSPFDGREVGPKPELVMVAGQVVATRGQIVGEQPDGRRVSIVR